MSAPEYRPRNSTSYDGQGNSFVAVPGAAQTAVPPAAAVPPVQNARPVPLPRGHKYNAQPIPQQPAAPVLQVQPQLMPPPNYPGQGVGMPQLQYAPPAPAAPANLAQQSRAPFTKADFEMKINASCMFCTLWKGRLEIVARVGLMVVVVFCFFLSAAIINVVDSNEYFDVILNVDDSTSQISDVQALIRSSKAVAGFMIFVAIVVFVVQIPTIAGRFVLRAGVGVLTVLHVADVITTVILGIFFLCGAAPSASYSSQWYEPPQICEDDFIDLINQPSYSCDEELLGGLLAGLSVWGFIGMGITIFLTVWTVLAMVTKWDHASNKSADAEVNTQ